MQSMNISLPDQLKQFVEGQVNEGRYSSVSEYVRELIRLDEVKKAQTRLDTLLCEGLASQSSQLSSKDWLDIRQEAIDVISVRRNTN